MTKAIKIVFNKDSFWSDSEMDKIFPLQKILNQMIHTVVSEENRWLQSQLKRFFPDWQRWLFLKSKFWAKIFGLSVIATSPLGFGSVGIAKYSKTVSIYRFDKLLATKTFVINFKTPNV